VVVLADGTAPALEFLSQLKQRNLSAHKTMVRRYQRHADNGPTSNLEHSRPIKGRKNLFEFKTKQGSRLLYFYMPGKATVLTNGFHKGDPPNPQFDKAEQLRDTVLKLEVGDGRT